MVTQEGRRQKEFGTAVTHSTARAALSPKINLTQPLCQILREES